MKQYQMSLIKGTKLVSTTKFQENTSKMIKFFREARPVVSMSNVRITEIKNVFHWFQGLMTEISVIDVSAKKKGKMSTSQNV